MRLERCCSCGPHTCGTAWATLSSRRASSSWVAIWLRAACRRSSARPDGPAPDTLSMSFGCSTVIEILHPVVRVQQW